MYARNDHVPMSSPLPVSGASGHVAPPVPGVRLGQVLGQGGFATVYAGEQVSLGRPPTFHAGDGGRQPDQRAPERGLAD